KLFWPALLDVEHLLDLVPHRLAILEVERDEGANVDPAVLLDLPLARLVGLAFGGVGRGVDDVVWRDLLHDGHGLSLFLALRVPSGRATQAIGPGDELDGMGRLGRRGAAALGLLHTLADMHAGQRAFRDDVAGTFGIVLGGVADDRLADLHADLEE